MSYDSIKEYLLLKEKRDKQKFIRKIGPSEFLILIFANVSRIQIPRLVFQSIDDWKDLKFEDWQNILFKIAKNDIAVIYSFLPFVWEFLKIDLLPCYLELENISTETKQRVVEKCYHQGKLKENMLRTYSPVMKEFEEVKVKLELIHDQMISQGANPIPETIRIKHRPIKKKLTLGMLLSELKKENPNIIKEFFPSKIVTTEQVKIFIESLDDETKKKLIESNPNINKLLI